MNVSYLLNEMIKGEGHDFVEVGNTRILYVHQKKLEPMYPRQTRLPVNRWFWHVVLKTYDYILDLDFSEAKPIAASAYFAQVFAAHSALHQDTLVIRDIPYADYLDFWEPITPVWERVPDDLIIPARVAGFMGPEDRFFWREIENGKGKSNEYMSGRKNVVQFFLTENSYQKYPPIPLNDFLAKEIRVNSK